MSHFNYEYISFPLTIFGYICYVFGNTSTNYPVFVTNGRIGETWNCKPHGRKPTLNTRKKHNLNLSKRYGLHTNGKHSQLQNELGFDSNY